MIIALRFNSGGRREVLGTDIDPSEAETFSTAFLHKLVRRSAGLLMLFLNIKGRRLDYLHLKICSKKVKFCLKV